MLENYVEDKDYEIIRRNRIIASNIFNKYTEHDKNLQVMILKSKRTNEYVVCCDTEYDYDIYPTHVKDCYIKAPYRYSDPIWINCTELKEAIKYYNQIVKVYKKITFNMNILKKLFKFQIFYFNGDINKNYTGEVYIKDSYEKVFINKNYDVRVFVKLARRLLRINGFYGSILINKSIELVFDNYENSIDAYKILTDHYNSIDVSGMKFPCQYSKNHEQDILNKIIDLPYRKFKSLNHELDNFGRVTDLHFKTDKIDVDFTLPNRNEFYWKDTCNAKIYRYGKSLLDGLSTYTDIKLFIKDLEKELDYLLK